MDLFEFQIFLAALNTCVKPHPSPKIHVHQNDYSTVGDSASRQATPSTVAGSNEATKIIRRVIKTGMKYGSVRTTMHACLDGCSNFYLSTIRILPRFPITHRKLHSLDILRCLSMHGEDRRTGWSTKTFVT